MKGMMNVNYMKGSTKKIGIFIDIKSDESENMLA